MYRVLQLQFVIAASIGTYFIENAPNVSKRAEAIVHCKNVIFNIVAKYWMASWGESSALDRLACYGKSVFD